MSIEILIEEERKSMKKIEDAKVQAEKIKAEAQKEAKNILDHAIKKEYIQEYIEKEEKQVNKEAEQTLDNFKKEMTKIKKLSPKKIERAIDEILNGVFKI